MEGMRGIAILMVFLVHFHAIFSRKLLSADSSLFALSSFFGIIGHTGVDLFFVLSGYLIYGELIDREVRYFKFLNRRVERIYPTFLVVFGIYLALSIIFPTENKIQGSLVSKGVYILENLLLLPGIFPITPIITVAWALSYEFFFYLSIPILVILIRKLGWNKAARVGFFVSLGVAYLFISFWVPDSRIRCVMFISGILVYEAITSSVFQWIMNKRGEVWALLLLLLVICWVYLSGAHGRLFSFLPGMNVGSAFMPDAFIYIGPLRMAFLSIGFFFFTIFCLNFDGIFKKVFSWAPLRYLGNMSYSYYLIHGLTLKGLALGVFLVMPASEHAPLFLCVLLVLSFIATLGTSTLLFWLVEKPLSINIRSASR